MAHPGRLGRRQPGVRPAPRPEVTQPPCAQANPCSWAHRPALSRPARDLISLLIASGTAVPRGSQWDLPLVRIRQVREVGLPRLNARSSSGAVPPPWRRGGTAPLDERALFTSAVYVLADGCAWRHVPPTFGVSPATAHRRFTAWTKAGLWRPPHRAVPMEIHTHMPSKPTRKALRKPGKHLWSSADPA
ncbi:transposase [Streptomyces sp. NBC_00400]|uniref:transposase n=1 Tax=Streptomyces sp. NBC_00400 TaxID=2975737 RepID=UPI003FA6CD22